ncbi:glycerol dehydratase reactivase beta/small subunit family protein [Natranaerofaba carboxydovora]|uniref:glycerol dehydratase reactivase beta/small subunit family protein n=1 Tax=Natranaerofaba carboxydovora TaxID=2742683 RepID=UPI001F13299B|nr:glycerol dehydratase reactivase beta/small subunit family protein [Natranaerofaba carboxydovora]UMZ73455.1 Propanediol dehydratase medium subunit [Natranaerofaba carboxydovora]
MWREEIREEYKWRAHFPSSIPAKSAMFDKAEDAKQLDLKVKELGKAEKGTKSDEVVIGISPAFGDKLSKSIKDVPHGTIVREIIAGLEEEGVSYRVVRVQYSADLGVIGNEAAKVSGSGFSIGILTKGTCLIHNKDQPPLGPIELYSVSPLLTLQNYRDIARNAGKYAKEETPSPVIQPYDGEAIGASFMGKAAVIHLTEAEYVDLDGDVIECEIEFEEK